MKAKLSIIRCEGLSCDMKNLGCYVLVNNNLSDIITPLISKESDTPISQPGVIEISTEGELKLVLKLMNGEPLYIGSVTTTIQSLPAKGYIWLPLSSKIDQDSFFKIGTEIKGPRLLISVQKPSNSIDSTHLYKLQVKKLEFIVKQLQERLDDSYKFYEEEKEGRKLLASAYEDLKRQFDGFSDKSQAREASMMKLLEKKDKELQESMSRANELKHKCEALMIEKRSLIDSFDQMASSKSAELIPRFNSEIATLKSTIDNLLDKEKTTLSNFQNIGKSWTDAMKSLGLAPDSAKVKCCEHSNDISLKAQILELTESNKALKLKNSILSEEKEKLSSQLFEIEELKHHQSLSRIEVKQSNLDDTLTSLGVQELFNKTGAEYFFNNQKINLCLENGKIVVNSLPVENFLQLSFISGLDKSILSDNECHSRIFTPKPSQSFEGSENISKPASPKTIRLA